MSYTLIVHPYVIEAFKNRISEDCKNSQSEPFGRSSSVFKLSICDCKRAFEKIVDFISVGLQFKIVYFGKYGEKNEESASQMYLIYLPLDCKNIFYNVEGNDQVSNLPLLKKLNVLLKNYVDIKIRSPPLDKFLEQTSEEKVLGYLPLRRFCS